jgi:hypothetical protein
VTTVVRQYRGQSSPNQPASNYPVFAGVQLIAPGAVIHFSGIGTFSGTEYIDVMAGILGSMEAFEVRPIDCAGAGDLLYIYWEASARIGGETRTWPGIDRMRIADGMAIEEHVVFDSVVLQPAG